MTITHYKQLLLDNKISTKELIQDLYTKSQKYKHLNTIISNNYETFISNCSNGDIPIALKDNFCITNAITTAASQMLKNYVSPITATVYDRLNKNLNCISVCKANMDEFAMGSSGKTSFFGPTLSPWKNNAGVYMSPGGSSSGSAAALASGLCLASLGTDTGGSVRQPAAWCGLVGFKPTYGALSRFGIIDYASDLDTPAIFTHTVEDCILMFQNMIGRDNNDYTTVDVPKASSPKKKVVIIKKLESDKTIQANIEESAKFFEAKGYEIKEAYFSFIDYVVPIYYILSCSGASSNLARYNGVLYNNEVSLNELNDIFAKTRGEFFGEEVQRRLIMGNYSMYSGHVDGFYNKARRILHNMWLEVQNILKDADFIIMPTTPGIGMTAEESKTDNPIKMYLTDIYTCFVNLLGLPAVNIPVELCPDHGTPLGIQLVANVLEDHSLLSHANILDKHFNFYNKNSLLQRKIV